MIRVINEAFKGLRCQPTVALETQFHNTLAEVTLNGVPRKKTQPEGVHFYKVESQPFASLRWACRRTADSSDLSPLIRVRSSHGLMRVAHYWLCESVKVWGGGGSEKIHG